MNKTFRYKKTINKGKTKIKRQYAMLKYISKLLRWITNDKAIVYEAKWNTDTQRFDIKDKYN